MEITNCHKNIMGTVSFTGKTVSMRKAQEFIVYPMQDSGSIIKVQSSTRIGTIDLFNGVVRMSQPHASGAYFVHLATDKPQWDMLSKEDCMTLKGWIKSTGGIEVGGVVKSDNTGALAL